MKKRTQMDRWYGWYSEKQAEATGTASYELTTGKRVETTAISQDPNSSGCAWDDMIFLGEINHDTCVIDARRHENLRNAFKLQ
jgi:hypothetical protein